MGFKSRAKKLKHAADAARPLKEDSGDDDEGVTPLRRKELQELG